VESRKHAPFLSVSVAEESSNFRIIDFILRLRRTLISLLRNYVFRKIK